MSITPACSKPEPFSFARTAAVRKNPCLASFYCNLLCVALPLALLQRKVSRGHHPALVWGSYSWPSTAAALVLQTPQQQYQRSSLQLMRLM
jgi:hypothetical protein